MAEKSNNWLRRIVQGRWLSLSSYKRNMAGVVVVVALFLIYITFKFDVQMKLGEIIVLREKLSNARTDMVKLSADYSSRTMESEMRQMLDTLHLPLKVAEQPPYYMDKRQEDGTETGK